MHFKLSLSHDNNKLPFIYSIYIPGDNIIKINEIGLLKEHYSLYCCYFKMYRKISKPIKMYQKFQYQYDALKIGKPCEMIKNNLKKLH